MNHQQIEKLFWETINAKQPYGKAIYNVITGVTKDTLHNWKTNRGPSPTIGDMLSVLYQMKILDVCQPQNTPQISVKTFRQWIIGAIAEKYPRSEVNDDIAFVLSREIIDFASTTQILKEIDETKPTPETL